MAGGLRITALTLYSTDGCHLCEEAEALLRAVPADFVALTWEIVDIAADDALFERYGWHIPVLRSRAGVELRWPFDQARLHDYLASLEADS